MTLLEIFITSILGIVMGLILSWIACEVIAEKRNGTPKMTNNDSKFCNVPNVLIQDIFDYKVKQ